MRRAKGVLAVCGIIATFGVVHLAYFAEKVRFVHALGLFASGMTFGAGLVGIILFLTGRLVFTHDKKPAEKRSLACGCGFPVRTAVSRTWSPHRGRRADRDHARQCVVRTGRSPQTSGVSPIRRLESPGGAEKIH
jgi:hypothetical protein